MRLPISGIGGVSNWRDAAEFILLGATTVQVCTAVMKYGFRIVEDMIDGLSNYLDDKGFRSVNEIIGRSLPSVTKWEELDLNYKIVASIDQSKCVGCGLCYAACTDGARELPARLTPFPTGYLPLDPALGGGLHAEDLVLMGGRPGIGKTIGRGGNGGASSGGNGSPEKRVVALRSLMRPHSISMVSASRVAADQTAMPKRAALS